MAKTSFINETNPFKVTANNIAGLERMVHDTTTVSALQIIHIFKLFR